MSAWKNIKNKIKKYVNASSDFGFDRILRNELEGVDTILDIGCGITSPLLRMKREFTIEGMDLLPSKSVDKFYDKYTRGNILNIEKYYKNKSFDVVVLFEVIEHLKRSEGKIFLEKVEKIAKKKIIISTPNGFNPQGPYGNNIYQEHLSGWFVSDFKSRGYNVYGIRGFKFIRGELAAIKYKPWYVWLYLSYLSEFIIIHFPILSFQLMAVKTLRK